MSVVRRRDFLTGAVAAATALAARDASSADVEPSQDLRYLDLTVEGDRSLATRVVLAAPKHLAEGERVPLLIALHGLAETRDERAGAWAFVEKYGLGEAYDRLRRTPIRRTLKQDYFGAKNLAALNAGLYATPFRGIAVACPYMPNLAHRSDSARALDAYADWISDVVLPRARKELPVFADAARTTIDGVSLGGWVGMEVFLRKAHLFAAWGCVQGALGSQRIASYAEKLLDVHRKAPKELHIETSDGDPSRRNTLDLAARLARGGANVAVLEYPGPHDQPWLRESGTIGMLRWHDARRR